MKTLKNALFGALVAIGYYLTGNYPVSAILQNAVINERAEEAMNTARRKPRAHNYR